MALVSKIMQNLTYRVHPCKIRVLTCNYGVFEALSPEIMQNLDRCRSLYWPLSGQNNSKLHLKVNWFTTNKVELTFVQSLINLLVWEIYCNLLLLSFCPCKCRFENEAHSLVLLLRLMTADLKLIKWLEDKAGETNSLTLLGPKRLWYRVLNLFLV